MTQKELDLIVQALKLTEGGVPKALEALEQYLDSEGKEVIDLLPKKSDPALSQPPKPHPKK